MMIKWWKNVKNLSLDKKGEFKNIQQTDCSLLLIEFIVKFNIKLEFKLRIEESSEESKALFALWKIQLSVHENHVIVRKSLHYLLKFWKATTFM